MAIPKQAEKQDPEQRDAGRTYSVCIGNLGGTPMMLNERGIQLIATLVAGTEDISPTTAADFGKRLRNVLREEEIWE